MQPPLHRAGEKYLNETCPLEEGQPTSSPETVLHTALCLQWQSPFASTKRSRAFEAAGHLATHLQSKHEPAKNSMSWLDLEEKQPRWPPCQQCVVAGHLQLPSLSGAWVAASAFAAHDMATHLQELQFAEKKFS
mmetsp:Transcript_46621/g.92749  ORF Transcript_46621/g.92749 Transcript_46621/m.92749 type:complete len:134 (+) Transcript_46621:1033-1434(+)